MAVSFLQPIHTVIQDYQVTHTELSWFMQELTLIVMVGMAMAVVWSVVDKAVVEVGAL